MDSGIYWEVFESTGSIEAYLTFKTFESSSGSGEDGSDIRTYEFRQIEPSQEKEIKSILLIK
jgi:hypothetical protein